METAGWTTEKLFSQVLARQKAGVAFHNEASLFMDYLGLTNMAELQSKRFTEEARELECIQRYHLQEYGLMLRPDSSETVELIPAEAYKTNRSNVGMEYKKKSLARFMELWDKWEKGTAELYSAAVSWCISKQIPDCEFFRKCLAGVQEERHMLRRLMCQMDLTGYSPAECDKLV